MPGSCIICKKGTGGGKVSLHRFPSQPQKRSQWLKALRLRESDVLDHHRVCIRHFPNQDPKQTPVLHIGKKFRSPKKTWTERGQRASRRSDMLRAQQQLSFRTSSSPGASGESSLQSLNLSVSTVSSEEEPLRMSTPIAEPLLSDSEYRVHELPSEESSISSMDISAQESRENSQDVIVTALVARLEALETENKLLRCKAGAEKSPLRVENISDNDSLVKFYTGFSSYEQLRYFFEFLGPAVNSLKYWADSQSEKKRRRRTKLNPFNQMFLTLVKLRLNLKEQDIAYRFDISVSTVSKYFITWVCFLYYQLTEIPWMPTQEQARRTLPQEFKEKFPDTYAIIDATEISAM